MYLTTSALIGHIKKSKKRKTILVKGTTATAILYKKQHAYTEHGSEQGGATWDYYKMEFIIKKADGDTFSISEIHIDFKAVILERLKVFPVKFINYDVVIPKTVFKDYKKANKRHRRKIETINPYFTNQEIEEFYSNLDLPV
ncbi:MAG: hypothetical protein FWH03_06425 [Firmicutes bacterium]|nr:hypothetical protein [Bacillota bacterium]